ncbi:hypothetical protein HHI36_004947 [Cryptolaemus montrouzieri]|uniref:Gustatory receptor n=1 Tax=Cryptolaemus montrouzieri TaxID=559131 RepID=A0ABD2NSQ7_9CUCU
MDHSLSVEISKILLNVTKFTHVTYSYYWKILWKGEAGRRYGNHAWQSRSLRIRYQKPDPYFRRNLHAAYERYSKYYNLRRRHISFKEGDLVWRRNKILSSAADFSQQILILVEHLLFILNDISKTHKCHDRSYSGVEEYFNIAYPQVFSLIHFSYWKAILVQTANILSTITWNYTDSFIILVSSGLALRFTQIANKIESKKFQDSDDKFWRETREDFNKICKLSRVIDENLSALVIVSFINNTFFICIQLYNSLKEREGFTEKLYYFYSFAFLLLRITSVTLYGAWINDESRKPLDMLHSVPSMQYNIEVNRFIDQINTMSIGLTGWNFFLVTRGFLLKIARTILTFELMILEFGPAMK